MDPQDPLILPDPSRKVRTFHGFAEQCISETLLERRVRAGGYFESARCCRSVSARTASQLAQ